MHIGKMIREKLQEQKISTPRFAKMLGKHENSVRAMLKKGQLHCALLKAVSDALEHNYFQYYVPEMFVAEQQLKEDVIAVKEKLKQCKEKTEVLKIENAHLKEIKELLKKK